MKCIIAGQGIAGSLLALALQKKGWNVTVADDGRGGASAAAAGLINPITGKRYALSWRFGDFWPVAKATYQALEARFGVSIWQETTMVRALESVEALNNWSMRTAQADFSPYLYECADAGDWHPLVGTGQQYGGIRCTARVDFNALREAVRQHLNVLTTEIHPAKTEEWLKTYDYILFSEGFYAAQNQWFPNISWQPAKGEALILRFPQVETPQIRQILKRKIALAPLGDGLFWAGANYDWDFDTPLPTDTGKKWLLAELHKTVAAPFEVVQHVAGIRAATGDRRPVIGYSEVQPRIGIFNAFGSKGALLTPYWAAHFAECLTKGSNVDTGVDCRRF
jgi:glycine oxidase